MCNCHSMLAVNIVMHIIRMQRSQPIEMIGTLDLLDLQKSKHILVSSSRGKQFDIGLKVQLLEFPQFCLCIK